MKNQAFYDKITVNIIRGNMSIEAGVYEDKNRTIFSSNIAFVYENNLRFYEAEKDKKQKNSILQ